MAASIQRHVSSDVARCMIAFAEAQGFNAEELLTMLGLPSIEALLARNRLSAHEHSLLLEMHAVPEIHRAIYRQVIERGLEFLFDPFTSYVSLCLASPTMALAVDNFLRFRPLVGSCDVVNAQRVDNRLVVEYRGDCHRRPESDQAFIYFRMLEDLVRSYDVQHEACVRMNLIAQATLRKDEYTDKDGLLPTFGQANNLLIIDAPMLDAPVSARNDLLYRLLQQQAIKEYNGVFCPSHFSDQVEHLIRAFLFSDDGTAAAPKRMVELVADKLHISRATLHRRLAAEKTTYTDLLAGVRRAEAARLLTETSMSVLDIGEILGFSDASSFNRFFREQFNQTPLKYRKSLSG